MLPALDKNTHQPPESPNDKQTLNTQRERRVPYVYLTYKDRHTNTQTLAKWLGHYVQIKMTKKSITDCRVAQFFFFTQNYSSN